MASGWSESWLGKQYNDIKGHLKWDAMKLFGGFVIAAAYLLFQKISHLESDWRVAGGLFVISIAGFFYAGRTRKDGKQQLQGSSTGNATSPTIAVNPGQPFNAKEFFRVAYYSPLQAEIEMKLRDAANQTQPTDREGFYLKCISIGVLAYNYDTIWWVIYRSQLEALLDLNRNNGILPLAKIRTHCDQAAIAFPNEGYKQITLDQWLGLLITFTLLIRHPSDMIEITVGGKDFLKYLLHWGREAHQRSF